MEPIYSTVFFGEGGCMIAINTLPSSTDFLLDGTRLSTADGVPILWPGKDGSIGKRVHEQYTVAPDSVFVAEFDDNGPVRSHPILAMTKDGAQHGFCTTG